MTDEPRTSKGRLLRTIVSIVACLLLIGGAAGASFLIFASEPTAQREGATRRSAALVETVIVRRGTHRPRLRVLGVVEPARDIMLGPRVRGQIVKLESCFVPGGLVAEGQTMLRIDPADFERVLTVRRSELRQVEAELAIEEGMQEVARREFQLLGEEIDPANRALVLREPQIASMRAKIDAARAAVHQAQLDLDRTTIHAPFDAQILTRSINLGSQVGPGDTLARLVGVDEYWVIASVPLRDLRWLRFASEGDPGSLAHVRHTTAWEPGVFREARVSRLIGTVDQQTRLARVQMTVPDPLARETDGPPMILGTIVQAQIEGQPLEDVVRLERGLLRQNDTVWVMVDGALEIRRTEVIFSDPTFAYVRSGVHDGDEVVTTSLASVREGLELRRAGDPGAGDPGAGDPGAGDPGAEDAR